MTRRSLALLAAVALPPLALAIVGTTHPNHLTDASALYWRNLHIAVLPVFPLLGLAPWIVTRRRTVWLGERWLTPLVIVLAFTFGVFYTALDVLAGIGAGGLKLDGMGMASGIGVLYELARALGGIGAIAFIAACAVTGVVSIRSFGMRAAPGALLAVAGSVLLFRDHIYFPLGVLGQAFLVVAWTSLTLVSMRAKPSPAAQPAL